MASNNRFHNIDHHKSGIANCWYIPVLGGYFDFVSDVQFWFLKYFCIKGLSVLVSSGGKKSRTT
jgi:hypothetical protein